MKETIYKKVDIKNIKGGQGIFALIHVHLMSTY
jgi:hypothetical protein